MHAWADSERDVDCEHLRYGSSGFETYVAMRGLCGWGWVGCNDISLSQPMGNQICLPLTDVHKSGAGNR